MMSKDSKVKRCWRQQRSRTVPRKKIFGSSPQRGQSVKKDLSSKQKTKYGGRFYSLSSKKKRSIMKGIKTKKIWGGGRRGGKAMGTKKRVRDR